MLTFDSHMCTLTYVCMYVCVVGWVWGVFHYHVKKYVGNFFKARRKL